MIDKSEIEKRARKRRLKKQIRHEAEIRHAEINSTPTLREIYAPKVIFGAVFILAIIGGILIGKVTRKVRDNENKPIPHLTAIKSLDALTTALGRYKFHVGHYPTTEQGLKALNTDYGEAGWDGPYLVQLMEDPWYSDYHYESTTNEYPILFSLGPDRTPHTKDDLHADITYYDVGTDWTNGWLSRFDRLPQIKVHDSPK